MNEIIALFIFITVMVGTPGPANLIMMSAGVNYGFRRSIPFMTGIVIGKLALNVAMAAGFYDLFLRHPNLLDILKYISAAYMLWLSFKMAKTPINTDRKEMVKAPGPMEGLIVHPLNPKAYAMMMIAWSDYGQIYDDNFTRLVIIGGCFGIVQIMAHSLWCMAGAHLIKLISDDKIQRKVQIALSLITALVVLYVVFK